MNLLINCSIQDVNIKTHFVTFPLQLSLERDAVHGAACSGQARLSHLEDGGFSPRRHVHRGGYISIISHDFYRRCPDLMCYFAQIDWLAHILLSVLGPSASRLRKCGDHITSHSFHGVSLFRKKDRNCLIHYKSIIL